MPPRTRSKPAASPSPPSAPSRSIRPADEVYYAYSIGRGEQLVLTYEPYKSHLLPLWRFKDPPAATESSRKLWNEFEQFRARDDFVGMDMARKFIQMGMTRAGRYANRAGGKKYNADGTVIAKSTTHKGAQGKAEASRIFRDVWERCKADERYGELRRRWQDDKKRWVADHPGQLVEVKSERDAKGRKRSEVDQDDAEVVPKKRSRRMAMKPEE
ncbi:hypothetical protein JCM10212_000616 [Sporobolomyces blumeae]